MSLFGVAFKGIGTALPETSISNDELRALVDTNDEWIVSRSGFKNRRVVSGDEQVTDLSVIAAKEALAYAGIDATEVDLIVHACSTPDYIYPAGASIVQKEIGAINAFGFDISMACSGMVVALQTACQYIQTGQAKTALVVATDANTRYTDWTDRNTCVLFGDGAGAFVLTQQDANKPSDLVGIDYTMDGTKGHLLTLRVDMPNCPLVKPREVPADHAPSGKVWMNGKEVFKFAVDDVQKFIAKSIDKMGLTPEAIDHYVFHQANVRILQSMSERMPVAPEKLVVSLENYGNTAAATIPLALMDALERGEVTTGKRLLFCAFGAGLAASLMILDWNAVDNRKLAEKKSQAVADKQLAAAV